MKTCISTVFGTWLSASGKTMAMLSIWPVLLSILRMPAASPRICGSTELMIALVLGETKKPEPPRANTIREQPAEGGDDQQGCSIGSEQQSCRQRVFAIRALQEENEQEQHRAARDTVQQVAQICQCEETVAEQAQLYNWLLNARLDHDEQQQRYDANGKYGVGFPRRQQREPQQAQRQQRAG